MNATTATCPCCHGAFKLDAEGRMSRHGFSRHSAGSQGYCDGGGRTVADAALRNVQVMAVELERLHTKRAAMVDEGKTVRRITANIDALERKYSTALNAL